MNFVYEDSSLVCEECGCATAQGLCDFCASMRANCALDPYYCVMEGD